MNTCHTSTPPTHPVTQAAHFLTYDLDGILYSDQRVVLNRHARILTLIGNGSGEFAAQACVSVQVCTLLQTLLDAHPAPCSQAALYAVWAGIEGVEAREMLKALMPVGCLDLALHGLHKALAERRAQLAPFNLGIQPVPEGESYRLFQLSLV